MADYVVTNAGSATFNDTYTENGAFNGKPCYEGDANGNWLYYAKPNPPGAMGWVLDPVKDNRMRGDPHLSVYAYWIESAAGTPPEQTYNVGTGDAPGADVAAYTPPTTWTLTVNSHDGLTPSIAFNPSPDNLGDNTPSNCNFSLQYDDNTSVTLTAPAEDPSGWNWDGWYVGGVRQTTSKEYNFSLTADTTVVATYTEEGEKGEEEKEPAVRVTTQQVSYVVDGQIHTSTAYKLTGATAADQTEIARLIAYYRARPQDYRRLSKVITSALAASAEIKASSCILREKDRDGNVTEQRNVAAYVIAFN